MFAEVSYTKEGNQIIEVIFRNEEFNDEAVDFDPNNDQTPEAIEKMRQIWNDYISENLPRGVSLGYNVLIAKYDIIDEDGKIDGETIEELWERISREALEAAWGV